MDSDDGELLRAYVQDGDQPAFARLVKRHADWIFQAARRRLGDEHLADDATQAAFLVLASKASQLVASKRTSLSPWLFHVMHFTCGRLRQRRARQAELERSARPGPSPAGPDDAAYDGELLALMEDGIAELPSTEREMVVRRFYQRQSFAEIGRAFDLSADAARKRVGRSLTVIRSVMLRDGIDAVPTAFLTHLPTPRSGREAATTRGKRIQAVAKGAVAVAEQVQTVQGFNLISVEFLVRDVEANLDFFEKLGFPRRWLDKPDASGRLPRASLTAGAMGKIWVRRAAAESEVHPSPGINPFFWVDGGPDALVAHRKKIADQGIRVGPIIDDLALPNFPVTTPDGYEIRFFTQYV